MSLHLFRKLKNKKNNIERSDIENNLGFVVFAAKKFCIANNCMKLMDDVIQAGTLGLMAACKKFDKNRGTKFTTYAIKWIKVYMMKVIDKNNIIHLPRNQRTEDYKRIEVLSTDGGVIGSSFNTSRDGYYDNEVVLYENSSFDLKQKYDTIKQYFIKLIQETLFNKINTLLGNFEKKVIELKYYKDYSFSEIGNELGFTKQNASIYEKLAIKKLRGDKEIQNLYPLYQDLCYN